MARLNKGDIVNYIGNGGIFKIKDIDWLLGYVKLYTYAKSPTHTNYKEFWCYINQVKLAGGHYNIKIK
jgi:hypothetical protein